MSPFLFLVTEIVLSLVIGISAQRFPSRDVKPEYTDGAVMAHTIGSAALNFEYYFYILGVACENRDQRFWKVIEKDHQKCMSTRGAFINQKRLPDGSFDKLCTNWRVGRQCKVIMAEDLDNCLASKKGSDALKFMDALAAYMCGSVRDTNSHLAERLTKTAIVPGVFKCFPILQDRIVNCVKKDKFTNSFCSQFFVVQECYGKYYTDYTCNDPQTIVYMRELFRYMNSALKCSPKSDDWYSNVFPNKPNYRRPEGNGWGNDQDRYRTPPPATVGWGPTVYTTPNPPSDGWGHTAVYTTSRPPTTDGWGQVVHTTPSSGGWGHSHFRLPPTPTVGWIQDKDQFPPVYDVGWGQNQHTTGRPTGAWGGSNLGYPTGNWKNVDDAVIIPGRRTDDPFSPRTIGPSYDILRIKVPQDDRYRSTSGRPIEGRRYRPTTGRPRIRFSTKLPQNNWVTRRTTSSPFISSTPRPQPQVKVRFTSENRPVEIDDQLIFIPTSGGGKIRPLRSDEKANLETVPEEPLQNEIKNDTFEVDVPHYEHPFFQEESPPIDNNHNEGKKIKGSDFILSTKIQVQPNVTYQPNSDVYSQTSNSEENPPQFQQYFVRPSNNRQPDFKLSTTTPKGKVNSPEIYKIEPSQNETIDLEFTTSTVRPSTPKSSTVTVLVPKIFSSTTKRTLTSTSTVQTPIRRKIRIMPHVKGKNYIQFKNLTLTKPTPSYPTLTPTNIIRIRPHKTYKTDKASIPIPDSVEQLEDIDSEGDLPSSASVEVKSTPKPIKIQRIPLKINKTKLEILETLQDPQSKTTRDTLPPYQTKKIHIRPFRKNSLRHISSTTATSTTEATTITTTAGSFNRKRHKKRRKITTTTTDGTLDAYNEDCSDDDK